jgi:hypothetical protein
MLIDEEHTMLNELEDLFNSAGNSKQEQQLKAKVIKDLIKYYNINTLRSKKDNNPKLHHFNWGWHSLKKLDVEREVKGERKLAWEDRKKMHC